jgi:hypothetical protein
MVAIRMVFFVNLPSVDFLSRHCSLFQARVPLVFPVVDDAVVTTVSPRVDFRNDQTTNLPRGIGHVVQNKGGLQSLCETLPYGAGASWVLAANC